MDTLFWTQLNSDVKFTHTRKQFYRKYLYKLIVYAPAGRVIEHKFSSVQEAIDERNAVNKRYNYGGSWYHRNDPYLVDADVLFLEHLRAVKKNNKNVKFRVEEPTIQIYAETATELENLVKNFKPDWHKYVEELTHPQSDKDAELLKTGAILVTKPAEYSHKVLLRDGRYSRETKDQIFNYLMGLGDLVKLSRGSADMLIKPYESMWGVFFYTNDPSVTTFLSLISPGLIANIHELIPKK